MNKEKISLLPNIDNSKNLGDKTIDLSFIESCIYRCGLTDNVYKKIVEKYDDFKKDDDIFEFLNELKKQKVDEEMYDDAKFLKNCIEMLKNTEQKINHENQVPLEELKSYKEFDNGMLQNMVLTVWAAIKQDSIKHNRLEGLLKHYGDSNPENTIKNWDDNQCRKWLEQFNISLV